MGCGLFCSQAGVGAEQEFVEFFLRCWLVADQGSHDRSQESERDAEDAGIFQAEPGFRLTVLDLTTRWIRASIGKMPVGFLWQRGNMCDLNDLIPDNQGWHLVSGDALIEGGSLKCGALEM